MKKLLFIGLLMALCMPRLFSQAIVYDEVVEVSGTSKDILFGRALDWFPLAFNNAKNVIQQQSKEEGQIIGKGLFGYSPSSLNGSGVVAGNVSFLVTIVVKDGRYRFLINEFRHEPSNTNNGVSLGLLTSSETYPYERNKMYTQTWYDKKWVELKSQTSANAASLINNLKAHMVKQSIKEGNW